MVYNSFQLSNRLILLSLSYLLTAGAGGSGGSGPQTSATQPASKPRVTMREPLPYSPPTSPVEQVASTTGDGRRHF